MHRYYLHIYRYESNNFALYMLEYYWQKPRLSILRNGIAHLPGVLAACRTHVVFKVHFHWYLITLYREIRTTDKLQSFTTRNSVISIPNNYGNKKKSNLGAHTYTRALIDFK